MPKIDNNVVLFLKGDSFTDLSPNAKTIANNGVTIVDNAFNFNGSSFLQIADNPDFTLGSNDFTIDFEVMLHTLDVTNTANVFGHRNSYTSSHSCTCGFEFTGMYFACNDNNAYIRHIPLEEFEVNKFYRVTICRSGNKLNIYINGKLRVSDNFSLTISDSTYPFKIGAVNNTSAGFLKGKVKNFLINNKQALFTSDFDRNLGYSSISINVTNQTNDKIDFNISKLLEETINKIEVLVNGQVSKTYDNIGDLTYNIDKSLCIHGINNLKIKVTFDNDYTEEKEITFISSIDKIPTSSSLKELIDRQELLTNSIEIQKNTLKSILESKNVEVSEGENKLSILINKVNDLGKYDDGKLWLYKDGVFNDNYVRTPHNNSIINYNNDNFVLDGINSSYWVSRLAFENVDFTQYSTLHIECSLTLGSSQSSRNSTINVNAVINSEGTSNPIGTGFTSAFSKSVKTINISNINGVYYLNLTCFDTNLSVYKIWLEK